LVRGSIRPAVTIEALGDPDRVYRGDPEDAALTRGRDRRLDLVGGRINPHDGRIVRDVDPDAPGPLASGSVRCSTGQAVVSTTLFVLGRSG
jgi:hypothetical protein